MSPWWIKYFPLVLLALSLLLYGNTFNHEFALDDDVVYLKNEHVQKGVDGLGDILSHGFLHGFTKTEDQSYRPLVLVSFALERQAFNNNPKALHIINVLWYFLCGWMVWLTMRVMLRKHHPIYPILIAVLFLAHPVHTEVVANIKGRDDLLHFFFFMSSLWLLFRYLSERKLTLLVWSLVCYFGALLCKEVAVTFVAIVPLAAYFFAPAPRQLPGEEVQGAPVLQVEAVRAVKLMAPYVLVFVIYFVLRASILSDVTFEEPMSILNNALAAAQSEADRIASVLWMQVEYLRLMVFPHPLSWDYSFNQVPLTSFGEMRGVAAVLVLLALGVFALLGLRKKDPVAFGILFYFITMSVVSNLFILIGATMAERFLFVPSVGFIMAIVVLGGRLLGGKQAVERPQIKILVGVVAVLLVLMAAKTITRNADWKNNDTLYLASETTSANSSRVQDALGAVYRLKGEKLPPNDPARAGYFQKAIGYYGQSLKILDSNFGSWYNIGVCYFALGQVEKAENAYNQTLAHSPNHQSALNNLGVIHFNRRDYLQARTYFLRIIENNPVNLDGLLNLGATSENMGDYVNAETYYKQALEVNPNIKNALLGMARIYRARGDNKTADYYSQLGNSLP
ncbi:MAG: tetratricopeptide repeat protein [Salibacteraceae bacterium]